MSDNGESLLNRSNSPVPPKLGRNSNLAAIPSFARSAAGIPSADFRWLPELRSAVEPSRLDQGAEFRLPPVTLKGHSRNFPASEKFPRIRTIRPRETEEDSEKLQEIRAYKFIEYCDCV